MQDQQVPQELRRTVEPEGNIHEQTAGFQLLMSLPRQDAPPDAAHSVQEIRDAAARLDPERLESLVFASRLRDPDGDSFTLEISIGGSIVQSAALASMIFELLQLADPAVVDQVEQFIMAERLARRLAVKAGPCDDPECVSCKGLRQPN